MVRLLLLVAVAVAVIVIVVVAVLETDAVCDELEGVVTEAEVVRDDVRLTECEFDTVSVEVIVPVPDVDMERDVVIVALLVPDIDNVTESERVVLSVGVGGGVIVSDTVFELDAVDEADDVDD